MISTVVAIEMRDPWPRPRREKEIRNLLRNESKETFSVPFKGKIQVCGVYEVAVDMPVYRLANGRTLASQQQYIADNSKQEDFFSIDPDSLEALQAQHIILREMAKEEELLDYFRRNQQIEPLILTQDGYVVNGNRRLCAMRMLLVENPEAHKRFEYIRVIFLPPCTERDIDILEAQLQIQPDIKAEYTWIDKAILLRDRQRAHNWTVAEIARIHQMSENEVRNFIDLLDHADQYLASRGRPRQYKSVVEHFYALEKLQKGRRAYRDEAARDAFTQLAYVLMDDPSKAGSRLYEIIPEVQENLPEIVSRIEIEIIDQADNSADDSTSTANEQCTDSSIAGDDDDLLGNGSESNLMPRVINVISNPKKHDQVRDCIRDVIESARQRKRQQKSANYCFKMVCEANTCLQTALTNLQPESNVKGITAQLDNIDVAVRKLRQLVSQRVDD